MGQTTLKTINCQMSGLNFKMTPEPGGEQLLEGKDKCNMRKTLKKMKKTGGLMEGRNKQGMAETA